VSSSGNGIIHNQNQAYTDPWKYQRWDQVPWRKIQVVYNKNHRPEKNPCRIEILQYHPKSQTGEKSR
jgi:hypothetical protein